MAITCQLGLSPLLSFKFLISLPPLYQAPHTPLPTKMKKKKQLTVLWVHFYHTNPNKNYKQSLQALG